MGESLADLLRRIGSNRERIPPNFPFRIGFNLTQLCSDAEIEMEQKNVLFISFFISLVNFPNVSTKFWNFDPKLDRVTFVLEDGSLYQDPKTIPTTASGEIARSALLESVNTDNYLINLVAAHQVRPLNDHHIQGYLRSKGLDTHSAGTFAQIVDLAAYAHPTHLTSAVSTNILEKSPWMSIHLCACSSPKLIMKMVNELKEKNAFLPKMVPEEDLQIVQTALDAPHDLKLAQAIPPRILVLTFAYLSVNNSLPRNTWYQGEKAKNDQPVTFLRFLAIFKQINVILEKQKASRDFNEI